MNINNKTYLTVLIIVLALFTIVNFSSCDDGPTEPDKYEYYHNKILFTSSRSGKAQLYMMNPDGTDIKQITSGEYSHFAGRWSPDASKIVAKTDENNSTAGSHIVTLNADGSNRKLLPVLAGNDLCWSPDGEKIAFSFLPSAEIYERSSYIYIINQDGTGIVQLTNGQGNRDHTPVWSMDGKFIYFSSNRHDISDIEADIYKMDIENMEIKRITETNNGFCYAPAISKERTELAFRTWNKEDFSKAGIAIMNLDGIGVEIIVQQLSNEIFNYPRWGPSSKNLVCMSALINDGQKTFVNIVDIEKKQIKRIIDDQTASLPDWSW